MNNDRRKDIRRAIGLLEEAHAILDDVLNAEQEAFDNMPEGLQSSERGEASANAISILEEHLDNIESAKDCLEDACE